MPLFGQPPDSEPLAQARDLLQQGQPAQADVVVTNAAKLAKKQFGSGSHPLACAYADMARLHFAAGDFKRAATEFRHAADSPMPSEPAQRADRLAFMFGFAACLEEMDKAGEAEKVYRQCADFAKNLHGPASAGYANSLEPLTLLLLRTGRFEDAAKSADEAYDVLWKLGDAGIARAAAIRAEVNKAAERLDDPFGDLVDLPDDLAGETVAAVRARAKATDPIRGRALLADLMKFAAKRFGDGHPAMSDTLAAIVHHESALGDRADDKLRSSAARRFIWSYAITRAPDSLLENIEVGFESDGTFHVVPQLARDPGFGEMDALDDVLTKAIDDLFARGK
jgi:hypothetical protein